MKTQRYTKTIEAVQFDGSDEMAEQLGLETVDQYEFWYRQDHGGDTVEVSEGDWVKIEDGGVVQAEPHLHMLDVSWQPDDRPCVGTAKDGVRVCAGDYVYWRCEFTGEVLKLSAQIGHRAMWFDQIRDVASLLIPIPVCYSTPELAEAARQMIEDKKEES